MSAKDFIINSSRSKSNKITKRIDHYQKIDYKAKYLKSSKHITTDKNATSVFVSNNPKSLLKSMNVKTEPNEATSYNKN